jgi:hypothetical protein
MVKRLQETIIVRARPTESRWVREMKHRMFGEYEAGWLAEGKAKGEAKGKRDALLLVLEGRGLSMTRAQRAAILGCDDLATLDRWIAGSGKVTSVRELLAAPAPGKSGAPKHRAARAA